VAQRRPERVVLRSARARPPLPRPPARAARRAAAAWTQRRSRSQPRAARVQLQERRRTETLRSSWSCLWERGEGHPGRAAGSATATRCGAQAAQGASARHACAQAAAAHVRGEQLCMTPWGRRQLQRWLPACHAPGRARAVRQRCFVHLRIRLAGGAQRLRVRRAAGGVESAVCAHAARAQTAAI
jgi:hypothetical protein